MIRSLMRDRRILAAGAAAIVVVAAAAVVATRGAPGAIVPLSTAPIHAPITSPLPEVPSPTAPASVGALPLGASEVATTSAPVRSAPPPPTPTPTPDPLVWRFEGRVVDEGGDPLKDVCISIGPRGCQRFSPHTDDRGVYFVDLPQNATVVYDLYFQKDGYLTVWYEVQPNAPTVFNVILRKPRS